MIDDDAAQAEGEALPATNTQPPSGGFFSRAKTPLDAVEAWYAQHFHRAAVDGRAPLSAEDYAALKVAVSAAASAQQE